MMTRIPFKAGGPIHPGDPAYVQRGAPDARSVEKYVCELLEKNDPLPVALIEPRQQGKTSLILNVERRLGSFTFVYIDASSIPKASGNEDWYSQIGGRIPARLKSDPALFPPEFLGDPPRGSQGWDPFLDRLARESPRKIVVALDEVGAIRFDGSDHFFSCIRALTTIESKKLNFILAGCVFPSELVRDPTRSPFNVATDVTLPDFTPEEVEDLLCRKEEGQVAWRDSSALAARIHQWSGGQPYLTQLLCGSLERPDATLADVDAVALECCRTDLRQIEGIRSGLNADEQLAVYLDELIGGRNDPMVRNKPALQR